MDICMAYLTCLFTRWNSWVANLAQCTEYMSREITTVIIRLAIVHPELSPTGPTVERGHARIPSEVVVETKFQVECLGLGFCGKFS